MGDRPVKHVWERVQFPCIGPSFGLAPTLLGPYLGLAKGALSIDMPDMPG